MSALEQWPVPPTWEEHIELWIISLRAKGLRPQTLHRRELHVRSLARALGCPALEVTGDQLTRWAGGKDWKPNTRNGYYSSITSFFTFLWREDAAQDPSRVLSPTRRPTGRPRPAPAETIRNALDSSDKRTALLIKLMAEYGLRVGEAVLVHLTDIFPDLTGESLLVHGKGGKERHVPLTENFAAELIAYGEAVGGGYVFPGKDNGHLSAHWAGKLVTRVMKGPWTAHTLRHRFGTAAYASSRDVLAVADLMGHANPQTTRGYVQMPVEQLSRLMGAISLNQPERKDTLAMDRLEQSYEYLRALEGTVAEPAVLQAAARELLRGIRKLDAERLASGVEGKILAERIRQADFLATRLVAHLTQLRSEGIADHDG